jgi:methyl-accepting chemotaxis protein
VQAISDNNILITAATITSELSEVRRIARQMSLGVMNAKAISGRAGDTARGFQPITDFIDEMAREVMRLVMQISREALSLSRMAVERNHILDTLQRYRRVQIAAHQAAHVDSLQPVMVRLQHQTVLYHDNFLRSIRTLRSLLDDINRSTRGAQVISATSRVEASRAAGFSASLEAVAENLEQATEQIRQRVKNSETRLRDVMHYLQREAAA